MTGPVTPSWYDVLDVDPTASTDEVRAAWRAGIAELEPGSRRFVTLNQAAEVLLDEQRRAAYDAELAARAPEPEPELELEPAVRDEPSEEVGPTRRSVPTWLIATLAALTLVVVGFSAYAWTRPQDRLEPSSMRIIEVPDRSEEAARAAQAAAERAVVPVLSYDYETLEADQERAVAYLTGDYREEYDKLFGVIMDNAPSTQTKVSAEVVASGIVRSGEERVDVLVFVDRPTVNKLSTDPVTYKDQVTLTMQKVDDEWLIDNMVTSPPVR